MKFVASLNILKQIRRAFALTLLSGINISVSFAQIGITNFYPNSAAYLDTVYVVGSGFGTEVSNLEVRLGSGLAEIASVEDQLIKVLTPSSATLGLVTVTNKINFRTATSSQLFVPVHQTASFTASEIGTTNQIIAEEAGLYDICTCDFDSDGDLDVGTANNAEAAKFSSVNVFSNSSTDPGSVNFTRVPGSYFNINQPARNITCQDLNSDGKPELIVSQGGNVAENLYIFQNTSSSSPAVISFSGPIIISTNQDGQTNSNRRIKIQDLDGDDRPEIVVTNQTNNVLTVFKNLSENGNISFPAEDRLFITLPAFSLGLDIRDLDGDKKADIIVGGNLTNHLVILKNQSAIGQLAFDKPQSLSVSGQIVNVKSGDLDGDGKPDIVATDFEDGAVLVFLNQSNLSGISFADPTRINAAIQPWGVDLADISGNQQLDIIVATLAAGDKVAVLVNNSTAGSPSFELVNAGASSRYRNLRAGDFNNDAKPDIITTEQDASGNQYVTLIPNQACLQGSISPESPPAICEANLITLYSTLGKGVSYQWYRDGTAISSTDQPTLIVSNGGDYSVEITDIFSSCSTTSAEVTVVEDAGTIPDLPVITAPTSVCEGENLIVSVPPNATLTYEWTGPNSFSSTEASFTISSVSTQQAGEYQLTVTEGVCKSEARNIFIEVIPSSVLDVSAPDGTVLCPGSTLSLRLSTSPVSDVNWFRNNQILDGESLSDLAVTQPGSYTATAVSEDGCTIGSEPIEIEELPLSADFSVDNNTVCAGQQITFTSQSVAPDEGVISYIWNWGDGSQGSGQVQTHTFAEAGTYQVQHQVTVNDGECISSAQQTIVVQPLPAAELTASTPAFCEGDTATLSINTTDNILWDDNTNSTSRNVTEAGTYTATVSNKLGCDTTLTITLDQVSLPSVSVEALGETTLARGDSVQLQASGATYYRWSPSVGLSDSTASTLFASPSRTTTYTVSGFNDSGCSQSAEITIQVDFDQIPVEALDIFSPNNDGIEDSWVIQNIADYPECSFIVFDLRGQEVFRSEAPYQNDWAGTRAQGSPLPRGVYYYVFRCGDSRNRASGSITIVR